MSAESKRDIRLEELEADNRRLRRLLDQQNAPHELRHRLRSTVAMARSIIRRSAETRRDLDLYVGHVEDRLDALVRAQAAADEHGTVSLTHYLADEFLHYGAHEGERIAMSGPEVEFRPRAGQVFALAMHELVVNAVEHGAIGSVTGRIEVNWAVSESKSTEPIFVLDWKEFDVNPVAHPLHEGFGTDTLIRLLGYELDSDTTIDFQAGGLRCTIRFPMPDRVGVVSRENT